MEQLILHLFGDYVTQTHRMATEKVRHSGWAFLHASIYSLPFLLLGPSSKAFSAILCTHFLIDRWRVARLVCWFKNGRGELTTTGYPAEVPAFLSVWLLIACDNTLHLAINYAALRWL